MPTPYSTQTWSDNNASFPVSAARMTHIETGIANAASDIATEESRATSAEAGLLSLSGGTMTGALTLASDPTSSAQAATKNYVDDAISGVSVGSATSQMPASLTSTSSFLGSGQISERIFYSNTAAGTLTVPSGIGVVGTITTLVQDNTGPLTIVAGTGVTINCAQPNMDTSGQNTKLELYCRSTNVYYLDGDLAAS